jgi:hypothetical protein
MKARAPFDLGQAEAAIARQTDEMKAFLRRLLGRRVQDSRLRLADAMRLLGLRLPSPLPAHAAVHLEEAKKRCLACNAKALCDEALADGAAQALSTFCPNTHYLTRVRHRRL